MHRFYSQNGEDFIANEIFKNQKNGYFVEIGCIDGRRFSNTLAFEERGWKGICIEAHNEYIELLKKNRPNSIIIHCAVGEKDEDNVVFYANARGSLSTLDPSNEYRFKTKYGKYFTGFKKQVIMKKTLNSIFEEYQINNIDLLSLDIEGYEIEALKGLDLKKYTPKLMIIESDTMQHEKKLDKMILPYGYYKSIKVSCNIFYIKNKERKKCIENKCFAIEHIHTEHPMDNTGDKIIKTIIDTNYKKKE